MRNMKQTPNDLLQDMLKHLDNPGEYTYIIMGKPGPTGKTWLCNKLRQYGYNACEITESVCWIVDYRDNGNYYLIKKPHRVVVIILNKPLEPAKEMTLEEIEEKLGHKVKVVTEKVVPIKNIETCEKCKYSSITHKCATIHCNTCRMYSGGCKCMSIMPGSACPYFEEETNNA